jgi:NTP pyrophosphatase (non-canonical NTP hydrolase)
MSLDFTQYQEQAMRTAKTGHKDFDLMHAAYGVSGEAGEFVDCIKKSQVYGRPLDHNHASEELGDILWFVALGCKALGVSMADVAERNIEKLRVRYPEKYTDALANERLDKV